MARRTALGSVPSPTAGSRESGSSSEGSPSPPTCDPAASVAGGPPLLATLSRNRESDRTAYLLLCQPVEERVRYRAGSVPNPTVGERRARPGGIGKADLLSRPEFALPCNSGSHCLSQERTAGSSWLTGGLVRVEGSVVSRGMVVGYGRVLPGPTLYPRRVRTTGDSPKGTETQPTLNSALLRDLRHRWLLNLGRDPVCWFSQIRASALPHRAPLAGPSDQAARS